MAHIAADRLIAAARALMLAGRWAQALELLNAAAADAEEGPLLAVAAAEIAVDQDFWIRTDIAAPFLEAASGTGSGWDVEFLRFKQAYNAELSASDWYAGPADRDPVMLDGLLARVVGLGDAAADASRRGWAALYAGLIEDGFRGDPVKAKPFYGNALAAAGEAGDDLLVSYALRHLGFLAAQDGDAGLARQFFQRSLELRQRLGCLPHVLAQYLALAGLARDQGDVAWSRAVAGVVHGWARTLPGESWLVPAAEMSGPP